VDRGVIERDRERVGGLPSDLVAANGHAPTPSTGSRTSVGTPFVRGCTGCRVPALQ
jgi:hypothetical protein